MKTLEEENGVLKKLSEASKYLGVSENQLNEWKGRKICIDKHIFHKFSPAKTAPWFVKVKKLEELIDSGALDFN